MLGFHSYFDIQYKEDSTTVSATHQQHFTPKAIPWYSFLLEAKWNPGLWNADKRNRSHENFQGPYQD